MANTYFTSFAEGIMDGTISLTVGVLKASYVRGYTPNAAHKFVSDVTGAGGILNGTSAALSTVTVTGGVLNAANTTVPTTANGSGHSILLFQSSAPSGGADVAASAQRLIAYFDTGTGLPVVPGTGNTPITWDTGTNKIVKVG